MDAFVAIGGCDKNMPGSMIANTIWISQPFRAIKVPSPLETDGKRHRLGFCIEGIGKWNHGDMKGGRETSGM